MCKAILLLHHPFTLSMPQPTYSAAFAWGLSGNGKERLGAVARHLQLFGSRGIMPPDVVRGGDAAQHGRIQVHLPRRHRVDPLIDGAQRDLHRG